MGTWSHESFGNDDAADWAIDLAESGDPSTIETALDAVLQVGDDDLEAPEAATGIAAAEVIARLHGHWGTRDAYSEPVDAWIERAAFKPDPQLLLKAQRVLDRVLKQPSELLELWEETEDAAAWIAAVRELKARVRI